MQVKGWLGDYVEPDSKEEREQYFKTIELILQGAILAHNKAGYSVKEIVHAVYDSTTESDPKCQAIRDVFFLPTASYDFLKELES